MYHLKLVFNSWYHFGIDVSTTVYRFWSTSLYKTNVLQVGDTFPARSECGNFKKCVESDGELNLQDNTDVKCPGENTKCEIQDGTGKCGCADGFEPDTDDSSNCKGTLSKKYFAFNCMSIS